MSLPRGFGSRDYEPDIEPPYKCKLGLKCSKGYKGKCRLHEWTDEHDDAWFALRCVIVFASVISTVLLIFVIGDIMAEPTRDVINGYNCNQLAEYIADKSAEYDYAEHRYEWLCVNEQIKEFQSG